ncbi:MAG: hypothetical protein ABSF77_12825 [Spirochaetia bacterium]|jgi:hypothetical protein
MKIMKIAALAAALALLPLTGAFALSAGGFTWGQQYFDSQFSNCNLQTNFTGVYGFRVTHDGQRIGGFAMAIHSDATDPVVNGGFVGVITGQEMRAGILVAAVNVWTGIGGMTPAAVLPGSLALFGEVSLEVGMGFIPGVMLTGYAGMQAMTSTLASPSFFSNVLYTPVFGMRIAWGSY